MQRRLALALPLLFLSLPSFAEGDKWRNHMQTLSATLVDAFPSFYSSSEFRDKKNEMRILKHINKLTTHMHTLPAKAGQNWIGAEPLIESAQSDIQKDLKSAEELFRRHEYEAAQAKVHGAIQRCFACHSAHQVGPQFPSTNSEVMAMATPFTLGKGIVFGALRQFDGTLDLIEKSGYAQISKENPAADELVKLYFVVALRVEQNFSRAQAFLGRLQKDGKNVDIFKRWSEDIGGWQKGSPSGPGQGEAQFIANLRESLSLHKQISDVKASAQVKKQTFAKLAEVYRALNFAPFKDLADLYAAKAK